MTTIVLPSRARTAVDHAERAAQAYERAARLNGDDTSTPDQVILQQSIAQYHATMAVYRKLEEADDARG